ncbi:MAG: hypothetical protein JSR73_14860 [Proteobacteria bacterium]|nr:hypothetical protein [Pseudomonadota bacterium]
MTALLLSMLLLPLLAAPLVARLAGSRGRVLACVALAIVCVLALGLAAAGGAALSLAYVDAPTVRLAFSADPAAALLAALAAAAALAGLAGDRGRSTRLPARALALVATTVATVFANDAPLGWACAELATFAAVRVSAAADTVDARRRARAQWLLAAAGGLGWLAALVLCLDAGGPGPLGAVLRAGATAPLRPLVLGLLVAGVLGRAAPAWLATRDPAGLLAGVAAAIVAIAIARPLAAYFPGAPALLAPAVVALTAVLALVLARRAPPATATRSRLAEFALAARLVWSPVEAAGPSLVRAALASGFAGAATYALMGVRVDAWPPLASLVVLGGAAWPGLAAAATLAPPGARAVLAGLAVAALAVFVVEAPTALAVIGSLGALPLLLATASSAGLGVSRRRGALGLALLIGSLAMRLAAAGEAPAFAAGGAGALAAGLAVAVPLGGAALLQALGRRWPALGRPLAAACLLAELGLAAALLPAADGGAAVRLALPGIALVADRLAAGLVVIVALLGIAAARATAVDDRGDARPVAAVLLGTGGLVLAALAADLAAQWLGFELAACAVLGLAAGHDALADRREAALAAQWLGALGLIAIAAVTAAVGTLDLAALAQRAPALALDATPLLAGGAALLIVALGARAGGLPFGLGFLRSLARAPAAAALLAIAGAEVAAAALLRVGTLVVPCFGAGPCGPSGLVLPLGLATLLGAGLAAVAARSARALAAALVTLSLGLLLVGIGGFRVASVTASLLGFAPAALGMAAFVLAGSRGGTRRAWLGASALAALGLPPFAGWLGRFATLAAAGADALVVFGLVLSAALLALLALARAPGVVGGAPPARIRPTELATVLLLSLALAAMAGPLSDYAARTARQVFDRASFPAAPGSAPPSPAR